MGVQEVLILIDYSSRSGIHATNGDDMVKELASHATVTLAAAGLSAVQIEPIGSCSCHCDTELVQL